MRESIKAFMQVRDAQADTTPDSFDITDYVYGISCGYGRSTELDTFQAGTADIELDNSDGRFTPSRTGLKRNLLPLGIAASSKDKFFAHNEQWPNGSATDFSNWYSNPAYAAFFSFTTSTVYGRSAVNVYHASGVASGTTIARTQSFTVAGSTQYTISAYVMKLSAVATLICDVVYYDATGSSTGSLQVFNPTAFAPVGSYGRLSGTFTTNPGTVRAVLTFKTQTLTTGIGQTIFDGIQLDLGASATALEQVAPYAPFILPGARMRLLAHDDLTLNLLPNADTIGGTGWTLAGAATTGVEEAGLGSQNVIMTTNGSTSSSFATVSANTTYQVDVLSTAIIPNGKPWTFTPNISVIYYTAANAFISSEYINVYPGASGDWTVEQTTFTTPATTAKIKITVLANTVGAETWKVNYIYISQRGTSIGLQPLAYSEVEKWPASYPNPQGQSMMTVPCVDRSTRLAASTVTSAYKDVILADAPYYYYPMTEPANAASSIADIAGRGKPSVLLSSKTGFTPITFGTADAVAGVTETDGHSTSFGNDTTTPSKARALDITNGGSPWSGVNSNSALSGITQIGNTIELWFNLSLTGGTAVERNLISLGYSGNPDWAQFLRIDSSNRLVYGYNGSVFTRAGSLLDGLDHHVVLVYNYPAAQVSAYLDGALVATQAITGYNQIYAVTVGAKKDSTYNIANPFNGLMGHVAFYQYQLSATQVLTHYNAGNSNVGENEYTRIQAVLGTTTKAPGIFQSSSAGLSGLQARSWTDTNALAVLQGAAKDAGGVLFLDANGKVFYQNRRWRLNGVSSKTFANSTTTGFEPGLAFTMDVDKVTNYVEATKAGGATYTAKNDASKDQYGKRSKDLTLAVTSDNEVNNAANWNVYKYKDPQVRVDTVTFDLSTSQPLRAALRNVWISTKITLAELPDTAPANSMDFFVESFHHDIRPQGNVIEWGLTMNLSPASLDFAWQLENTTYGSLDGPAGMAY